MYFLDCWYSKKLAKSKVATSFCTTISHIQTFLPARRWKEFCLAQDGGPAVFFNDNISYHRPIPLLTIVSLCWTMPLMFMFRIPVRECARTLWMWAPFWGRGDRIPEAGTRSVSWTQIREERRRDRMRRRQEAKEDDPFMASICQHAQSKLVCIARKKQVNVSLILYSLYWLYLLFQENKSFGASTICIHPLM